MRMTRTLAGVLLCFLVFAGFTRSEAGNTALKAASERTDSRSGGFDQAQAEIRRAEYNVSEVGSGTLTTPNRANGLQTFFSADGVRVVPRTEADGSWELRLRLLQIGRGANAEGVQAAAPEPDDNRVEFRHGTLVEWYVNAERGLEQGFTLSAPPPGGRQHPVVVEMQLGGNLLAFPSSDGQTVTFRTPSGANALHYRKLVVRDAAGNELPARMEVAVRRLSLVVEDAGAAYPIEIDPLLSQAAWTFDFGGIPRTAGDVNGDGYSDLILLQSGVHVFYGSPSGPSTTPSWTVDEEQAGSAFGDSFGALGTAGDVNGDGYSDVIVGASDGGTDGVPHLTRSGSDESTVPPGFRDRGLRPQRPGAMTSGHRPDRPGSGPLVGVGGGRRQRRRLLRCHRRHAMAWRRRRRCTDEVGSVRLFQRDSADWACDPPQPGAMRAQNVRPGWVYRCRRRVTSTVTATPTCIIGAVHSGTAASPLNKDGAAFDLFHGNRRLDLRADSPRGAYESERADRRLARRVPRCAHGG